MVAYSPDWVEPFKGWCQREIDERRGLIVRLEGTKRIGEGGEDVTEEEIASLQEEIASIGGAIVEANARRLKQ